MQTPLIQKRGIPTMYKGRQYRSRLEARWAVFFDLVGWRYEYEPFDLDGWIPDFALPCHPERAWLADPTTGMPVMKDHQVVWAPLPPRQILVEIKPTFAFEDFPQAKILGALRGTEHWKTEVLLLGNAPMAAASDDSCWGSPSLGWLGESCADPTDNDTSYWFEPAILNFSYSRLDFFHAMGAFRDRIHGFYDGPRKDLPSWDYVQRLWNQAGNTVQWKAPRNRI